MRQEVIDYINTLSLGGFLLSAEIPWEQDGVVLYLKNLKKIYVGLTEKTEEAVVRTLDALQITSKVSIISIFFACDAKQIPSNYEVLVDDLLAGKNIALDGVVRRESDVSTTVQSDTLITEIQIRFTTY
jgi:hypothetical protein